MKTLLFAILCAGTTLLGQTPTKAQAAQDCANYRALQIARGATPDQIKRMDACGIVKPEDVPECPKCKPTDCEKFDGTTYTPAPCDAQTDPQGLRGSRLARAHHNRSGIRPETCYRKRYQSLNSTPPKK